MRNNSKPKLVTNFGEYWSRHHDNIKNVPHSPNPNRYGIYILFDGLFPVYVGKANGESIRARISSHNRNKRMRDYWDRFSWYVISDRKYISEMEALLLRTLPYFSRILTGQRAKFLVKEKKAETKEIIERQIPKKPPRRSQDRK